MIIIYGSALYGRVDRVPGHFHIATRFAHVYYVPLIPIRSYAVLSESGPTFQGVRIGLNLRSVLMAWLRTALLLTAVIATVRVCIESSHPERCLFPAAVAAGAIAGFVLAIKHPVFTRASAARAEKLARKLGVSEDAVAQVRASYPARPAFELMPVA